jgi:hypothetical protein
LLMYIIFIIYKRRFYDSRLYILLDVKNTLMTPAH